MVLADGGPSAVSVAPETEVEIRPLTEADLPPLRELLAGVDAFRPDEVDCAVEVVQEFLAGDGDYHPLIIWEGARPAGFVCYGPVPLTEGTFDLYWIAVGPEFRGRGYGHRLMDVVVEGTRSAGGRVIVIETSSQPSHADACTLYVRCGFTEAARIAEYYAPGDDLIIYTRHLELAEGGAAP